jgi:hypothetical protein
MVTDFLSPAKSMQTGYSKSELLFLTKSQSISNIFERNEPAKNGIDQQHIHDQAPNTTI